MYGAIVDAKDRAGAPDRSRPTGSSSARISSSRSCASALAHTGRSTRRRQRSTVTPLPLFLRPALSRLDLVGRAGATHHARRERHEPVSVE